MRLRCLFCVVKMRDNSFKVRDDLVVTLYILLS